MAGFFWQSTLGVESPSYILSTVKGRTELRTVYSGGYRFFSLSIDKLQIGRASVMCDVRRAARKNTKKWPFIGYANSREKQKKSIFDAVTYGDQECVNSQPF